MTEASEPTPSPRERAQRAQALAQELQNELQLAVARFQLILKSTSDGLWDVEFGDRDCLDRSNPCWFSDSFRTVMGFDESAGPASLWLDAIHAEDRPKFDRAFREHVNTPVEGTFDLRFRMHTPQGLRWFHGTGGTLRSDSNQPLRFAGVLRDVTREEDLVSAVRGVVEQLDAAAKDIRRGSEEVRSTAQQASTEATEASKSASSVHSNVQHLSQSSSDLEDVVREIAKNASEASAIATRGVQQVSAANETMQALGSSSQEIGKVTKLIISIAEQTNLLALNATIEAARAGAAGKGFAVVANEVKELAKETAKATESITEKIEAIQKSTTSSLEATAEISNIIGEINGMQTSIAGAVEEQHATIREVARFARTAEEEAQSISTGLQSVSARTVSAESSGKATEERATHLAALAQRLSSLVS